MRSFGDVRAAAIFQVFGERCRRVTEEISNIYSTTEEKQRWQKNQGNSDTGVLFVHYYTLDASNVGLF